MKSPFLPLSLAAAALLVACHKEPSGESQSDSSPGSRPAKTEEHIDPEEKALAAKLVPAKDPVSQEINAANLKTRQNYNSRRFDELEKEAAGLRASQETFGNGSWKIAQFHESLECDTKEPESMWQLHDKIHQEWIATKPDSATARVAYAQFLISYAWHARGSGYADTVSKEGWRLFGERLDAALKVLMEARGIKEKDPCLWLNMLTVALGQGWDAAAYDKLMKEAHAAEPKFWGYDTSRAYSLLPRWHGEPGDWEAFAAQVSARPEGPGIEVYARIVFRLRGFYDNVFRETKASWPKTKEGLNVLLERYPDSLGLQNEAALLATMAEDRPAAKAWFDKIGDRYLPSVFRNPERFVHYRHWAETGQW